MKISTPELDKMGLVQDKSQAIGEFLEWLQNTKGYTLAEYRHVNVDGEDIDDDEYEESRRQYEDRLFPVRRQIEQLLAEYFEIDLDKVEAEKRTILDALRRAST